MVGNRIVAIVALEPAQSLLDPRVGALTTRHAVAEEPRRGHLHGVLVAAVAVSHASSTAVAIGVLVSRQVVARETSERVGGSGDEGLGRRESQGAEAADRQIVNRAVARGAVVGPVAFGELCCLDLRYTASDRVDDRVSAHGHFRSARAEVGAQGGADGAGAVAIVIAGPQGADHVADGSVHRGAMGVAEPRIPLSRCIIVRACRLLHDRKGADAGAAHGMVTARGGEGAARVLAAYHPIDTGLNGIVDVVLKELSFDARRRQREGEANGQRE